MALCFISSKTYMCLLVVVALHLLQLLAIIPVLLSANIALPGCISKCGEVSIPYPFGVGAGCYRKGFKVTCNETSNPPKLFLDDAAAEVLNISLEHGTLYINSGITRLTGSNWYSTSWGIPLANSTFTVSASLNKFIVMGCGFQFLVRLPDAEDMVVACASSCLPGHSMVATDGTCSGVGCCETSMPGARSLYSFDLYPFNAENDMPMPRKLFNATVIVVEKAWWDSDSHVMSLQKAVSDGLGISRGLPGFHYVKLSSEQHANFSSVFCIATDIDECAHPDNYACFAQCINKVGSYDCICPQGTSGKPQKPHGCIKDTVKFSGLTVATGVGSGACLVLLTFFAILLRRKLRARKAKQLRDFFFRKNRGLLLQQLVDKDIAEKMIFSLEELEKATNKFDEARKIGKGGHGMVYKGILSDQRVVAIKKSREAVQRETDNFINEVAILSQVNHRNVVELFGCCLETEVPLLIYEFISNGTLYEHLHVNSSLSLPWRERLRIALEVARSLAYLHSAASVSIIHRDIKATNILLDDNLTAKVSDFGASRGIPIDQTRLTTAIQGTFGYLDPECYNTRQLTDKSDVYSFGVMLVELLTREKPHMYMSPTGDSLMAQFLLLQSQDKLSEILNPQVAKEGKEETSRMAEVAARCISSSGKNRPTMKQVEMRLEALYNAAINIENGPRTKEHILNIRLAEDRNCNTDANNISRRLSMEREILLSMSFPR